ncbi:MAG: hypothetical protein R8K22_01530 [Mariprofundaceae bacterium]
MPWLALQWVTLWFNELPVADVDLSFKYFLLMLQGFSCGVIGGFILLPRCFIKSEMVRDKLRISRISCFGVTAIYFVGRTIVFGLFKIIFG